MEIKRFDILMCNLGETIGSEQGGKRPVVVIQNNIGNAKSTTTIVMPLSKNTSKNPTQPTHTLLFKNEENGLKEDSIVLGEQIRVISNQRILWKIGCIKNEKDKEAIRRVYEANFGF